MQKPSITIQECCQIMRDNNISIDANTLSSMIQAGSFPAWAIPSTGTKNAAPLISRAGFMTWVKNFYCLKKVYTQEDPRA